MSDEPKPPLNPHDELWVEQEPDSGLDRGSTVAPPSAQWVSPSTAVPEKTGEGRIIGTESTPKQSSDKLPVSERADVTSGDAPVLPVPETSSQYIAVGPSPIAPSKKKWLIPAIIVGIVALIGAGATATYALWYQNPSHVLADALTHAIQAKSLTYKGTYVMERDGMKLTANFDGNNPALANGQLTTHATLNAQGQVFQIDAAGLVDTNGIVYLKLANVRAVVDQAFKQNNLHTISFDSLIAKIDNQWIKLTANDMQNVGAGATQACVTTALKSFQNDQTQQKQLSDLYKQHPFIAIKKNLGDASIDGVQSLGYEITSNSQVLKDFVTGINSTKLAATLRSCNASFVLKASDIVPANTPSSAQVWVSQWTHQLTRVVLTDGTGSKSTTSLLVEPKFNAGTPIMPPAHSLTLQDLQAPVQEAISGFVSLESESMQQKVVATQAKDGATSVVMHVEAYNAERNAYPTLAQLQAGAIASAKLPANVNARVGTAVPSVTNPLAIEYQLCSNGTGAYISYFDAATAKVIRLTAGTCTA